VGVVQPGIFTVDGTAGAILHGASYQLVTATNPAARREVVVIYATGLGPVSPQPRTGAPAPNSEPLSRTPSSPAVTVGGINVEVLFSGLAPGFVGLYQVNVRIPADAPPGSAPVVMTLAGVSSKPATVFIAGP